MSRMRAILLPRMRGRASGPHGLFRLHGAQDRRRGAGAILDRSMEHLRGGWIFARLADFLLSRRDAGAYSVRFFRVTHVVTSPMTNRP